MEGLSIDYCIKETDFKHIFSQNEVLLDPLQMQSPYLTVNDENTFISVGKDACKFPDGKVQGHTELQTLRT